MPQKIIKDETGKKFELSRPPREVFLFKNGQVNQHSQQQDPLTLPAAQNEMIPHLDESKGYGGVTYPESGGMYLWHVGRDLPRKGHVYPEALRDIYYPKRVLVNMLLMVANKDMMPFFILFGLLPKKLKGRILNRVIDGYLNTVYDILIDHYLYPQFNTDICRELSQPIMTFLTELGVEKMRAAKMSLIFITLLEYDAAYRLRIEDLLTETTKEKLLADPVGEARKLIAILAERDWSRPHLVEKFDRFARLLKYGFFFIRKPFRKALEPVDFAKLQLDEYDHYMVRHWIGYNWFGMNIEERVKKWPPVEYPVFKLVSDEPGKEPEKVEETVANKVEAVS